MAEIVYLMHARYVDTDIYDPFPQVKCLLVLCSVTARSKSKSTDTLPIIELVREQIVINILQKNNSPVKVLLSPRSYKFRYLLLV